VANLIILILKMAKFALKSQKKFVSFWVHFSIKKIAKKKNCLKSRR